MYRASLVRTGTLVALKFLKPDQEDPEGLERFHREAVLPAKVRVGVVKCLELRQLEGRWCLVSEFIEGQSLKALLHQQAGPLDQLLALRIGLQIATTLERSHQVGIIHRDLTPRNILLPDFDPVRSTTRVKVIDWGIAKEHRPGAQAPTRTRPPPDYVPPEGSEHVDPAVDIFTFGSVLYEMLAGELPNPRWNTNASGLFPAVRVPQLSHVDDRIKHLLSQCLCMHPSRRPRMSTVREVLQHVLQEEEARPRRRLEEQLRDREAELREARRQRDALLSERDRLQLAIRDSAAEHDQLLAQHQQQAERLQVQQQQLLVCQSELTARSIELQKTQDVLRAREQEQSGEQQVLRAREAKLQAYEQEIEGLRNAVQLEHALLEDANRTIHRLRNDSQNQQLDTSQRVQRQEQDLQRARYALEEQERQLIALRRQRQWLRLSCGAIASIAVLGGWVYSTHQPAPVPSAPAGEAAVRTTPAERPPAPAPSSPPAPAPVAPTRPVEWRPLAVEPLQGRAVHWMDVWGDGRGQLYVAGGLRAGPDQMGGAILLASSDNGKQWTQLALSPRHPSKALYALWGAPTGEVFAAGEGVLYRVNGDAAEPIVIPFRSGRREPIRGLWGASAEEVYLVSSDPGGHMIRCRWPAGGPPQLREVKLPTGNSLRRVWGTGEYLWAAGDAGTIVRYHLRSEARANFEQRPGAASEPGEVLYDIGGDEREVVFCGAFSGRSDGVMYRHQPSSGRWERVRMTQGCYRLLSLETEQMAAGIGRAVLRSSDRWRRSGLLPLPPRERSYNIKGIWGTTSEQLTVVGWDGLLMQRGQ